MTTYDFSSRTLEDSFEGLKLTAKTGQESRKALIYDLGKIQIATDRISYVVKALDRENNLTLPCSEHDKLYDSKEEELQEAQSIQMKKERKEISHHLVCPLCILDGNFEHL